ncbi:MAG: hypothetical protein VB137_15365 [Burkholderia sp.]
MRGIVRLSHLLEVVAACAESGCLNTILRSGSQWQERCLTGFEGCLEAQFFETPFAIVSILERDGGSTNFFNVFEQTPVDSRRPL